MGRDRDEAVSFYGPILARDIIMTMTLCFHSRGGEMEGRESKKEKVLVLSMAKEQSQQIRWNESTSVDVYLMQQFSKYT